MQTVSTEIIKPIACRPTSNVLKMIDSCQSASMGSYSYIEQYYQNKPTQRVEIERSLAPQVGDHENENSFKNKNSFFDESDEEEVVIHSSPTIDAVNDGCFEYPF